jgi:uncharacterized membrane protein
MMNWWYGGSGDVGLLGGLVMIALLSAVVALAVLSVQGLFPSLSSNERDSALEILNRRLAAGELSQAEYEQARRSISQHW